jgi:hypothetical protein
VQFLSANDDEVRTAVREALAVPETWEMFGGEEPGGILSDGIRMFRRGEPGFVGPC